MSVDQQLHWVALPAGAAADGQTLRLSVFVAPQLRTDEAATLAPFPDFVDWPSRILAPATSFTVELPNGSPVAATRSGPDPEPALWRALFDEDTPLRPFTFDDYADRPIVSFSSRGVLDLLRRVYTAVAAAAPDHLPAARRSGRAPGLADLVAEAADVDDVQAFRYAEFAVGVDSGADLDRRITDLLAVARAEAARRRSDPARRGGEVIEPLRADGTPTGELARLLVFHRRPGDPVDLPADRAAAARHFGETVDFHQMLAALGDHPALLRRLGLIVDLTVPAAEVPDSGPFDLARLRVVPTWESALPAGQHSDASAWTMYRHVRHEGERFFAAAQRLPDPAAPPAAPPIGLLPLPDGDFAVEQVDVDGAGLKALNLASTLDRAVARTDLSETFLGEPEGLGVPALRTSGIALSQRGRAGALQRGFVDQLRLHQATVGGAAPTLWAEDLTRGYRLDVWDDAAGRWSSLHRRTVTYNVSRLPNSSASVDDEGMFQLSLAESAQPPGATPDASAEVYVHERIVTWDGWSLAASRPGKDLGADAPERTGNDALTALGISIEAVARRGSLPRLRFGRGYRLRVRTVDLAGNGPTLEEADRRLAMPGTDTPVVPPAGSALYARFEPVPPPVLVPRVPFEEGSSLQHMVVRSDADRSAAEFAAAFNRGDEVVLGAHPPLRPHDERHVAPPKTSLDLYELHGLLDAAIGSDGRPPDEERRARVAAAYDIARREQGTFDDPSAPGARAVELAGAAEEPQRYVCHDVDDLAVPYLPDPLAWGVALFGLPGVPDGEAYHVDVQGVPSEGRAFRLRLEDGDAPPAWDEDARVLSVWLPQAASVTVQISSALSGREEELGVLQWCLETLDADAVDRVLAAAREDRCWLLTPWIDLRLVHAVQRPLTEPLVDSLEVSRDRDDVAAHFFGFVTVHVPSTERVDLVGAWSETVDDVAEAAPRRLDGEAAVFSLPLADAERYAGWDPADAPFVLEDRQDDGHAVLAFNTRGAWSLDLDTPASHKFGDTRHRRVSYRLRATTPFREYYPPAWGADPERLSRTSDPLAFDVPSSAPPAVPQVTTVVPTLGWEVDAGAGVRQRRGGGLRVWLDRPWFSSGDGELLGVVTASSALSPLSSRYPYVTLVARDQVRDGAPLAFPTLATFRHPDATARVPLVELGLEVDVACYAPTYDEGSRRWFCDIDLETGEAYFPFVRLALVRYQAHALRGCHVSPVVLADVVQTLPDRTLTVTAPADEPRALHLALSGPTYTGIRGPTGLRRDAAALARVVATVERRDARIADDELGWHPVEGREVDLVRSDNGTWASWTGDVDTSGLEPGIGRVRIVEYDHLASDPEVASPDGLVARVVYADVVELGNVPWPLEGAKQRHIHDQRGNNAHPQH